MHCAEIFCLAREKVKYRERAVVRSEEQAPKKSYEPVAKRQKQQKAENSLADIRGNIAAHKAYERRYAGNYYKYGDDRHTGGNCL